MTILGRAPIMDADRAQSLVADLWGLREAAVRELGSHQDRNFLITAGGVPHVLKVANSAVADEALDAQNAAMLALAGSPLRSPMPIAARTGSLRESVDLAGTRHSVRLLSYVRGTPMSGFAYLAPSTARLLGALAGQVGAALAEFDHPGCHQPTQWDLRGSDRVVLDLVAAADPPLRLRIQTLSDAAHHALRPVAEDLPHQAVHGDITDFNVVAELDPAGRPRPIGVIDFGDLTHSWRAAEAAITICALLGKDPGRPLRVAEDTLVGFMSEQPLTALEVDAIWPMVATRACAGLVSTLHQMASEPTNEYLHENLAVDRQVFEIVTGIPMDLGTLAMRRAAGLLGPAPEIRAGDAPILPEVGAADVLDLSPTSPLLDAGAWLEPARIRSAVRAELQAAPGASIVAYGEFHLHRSAANSLDEPATCHMGVDVITACGTRAVAPWSGAIAAADPWQTRLVGPDGWDLVLHGARPLRAVGAQVSAGTPIAEVTSSRDPALPDHVHVQVLPTNIDGPTHVPASTASLWRHLSPDPSALLGRTPLAPGPAPADLLARRSSVLAAVQKHYWEAPPQIERGWQHHLVDTTGRVYLDGINNVTVLGHSHPAVADAVSRQLRTLNTNSRFHYEAQVEFAEMLVATMPAGLDRVFLLATGSETVDLALRLARVHTRARDTIALRTAYHGWTTASDEVSSALMDNPRALETRPDWIHLAEPPNLYRGPHTGPQAGTRYADDVRRILAELAARGRTPAAFICETLNGNAGGIELPDDYLAQVYADVRAAGGVVIADEVQVGYGRLGSHFWGFEMAGVVPDIVCLAKATGNGYPVSAVVCTQDIAESFAVEGSLFASMGGTPAGAAAAIATLRTLDAEDLMGNAARMGARLRTGLEALVSRHAMAGAVHGRGLYLGLELVTDPDTRTPATQATDALCERLLDLGVVMAATGDHMNVLKIKPPLCIDSAGVDFLLEALEVAFTQGW